MGISATSWALFSLGALALLLALNAWRPSSFWLLRGPSFVAQVLIAELAPWAIFFLFASAAILATSTGALGSWPGLVGITLCAVAMLVLFRLIRLALDARTSVEAALKAAGLGAPATSAGRWRRALLPRFLNSTGVERIDNLRYAEGAGSRRLLDIYRPRGGVSGAPVLLQIHGGAWVVGSKRAQGRPLMTRMASAGWVCAAINYRLSPRVRFPEHLIDCKHALAWIRAHIAEYGGDPNRVVVTGGSAGGHLAAMVALTQNDPAYQPGFETADTSVMACVPVYGPFDVEAVLSKINKRLAVWFTRGVFGTDPKKASPITHVRGGLPPMFVIQGTQDNLVPHGLAQPFITAVRAAGNENVVYLEVPGAAHAFDFFYSIRSEAVVSGIHCFLENLVATRPAREP